MTQKRAHACEKLGMGDRHLEHVGGAGIERSDDRHDGRG
jgi:hypothetical protein